MGVRRVWNMSHTCVAYACVLVLLCPRVLSQLDTDYTTDIDNDEELHIKEADKFHPLGPTEWSSATLPQFRSRFKRQIEKEVDYYTEDDESDGNDDSEIDDDYKEDEDESEDGLRTTKQPNKLVVTRHAGKLKLSRYGIQSPIIIVTETPTLPAPATFITSTTTSTTSTTPTTTNQPRTTRSQAEMEMLKMQYSLMTTSPSRAMLEQIIETATYSSTKSEQSFTTTPLSSFTRKPVSRSSTKSLKSLSRTPKALFSPKTTSTSLTIKPTVKQTLTTNIVQSKARKPRPILTTKTTTTRMTKKFNRPPKLKQPLDKLVITAGKAFRYIFPVDVFTDPEDGLNLSLRMFEADNSKLDKDSWVQFLPFEREVYGLPLESHVSTWNFVIEARDRGGKSTHAPLEVTVQPRKGARIINHKFIIEFKLNQLYTKAIDWQIRALEGIVSILGDTDMEQFTVLDAKRTKDICKFVWTNETVANSSHCHLDGVEKLMKIISDGLGAPSPGMVAAFRPELVIITVRWEGVHHCGPVVAMPNPPFDLLTATAGHLLVHKIPEDTFFDPEDGGTRNLALSLRLSDGSELPRGHWLQFDVDNQEFYGLPGPKDVGTVNYQLIAEDSAKKSTFDNLMVEVVKAPPIRPTAEFRMTLHFPYPDLAFSAKNKRKLVEKIATLFGQSETTNIRIVSISDSPPTTVIWYNTSLLMDACPKAEIRELREIFTADEGDGRENGLKQIVDNVFEPEFKVMSITIDPVGLCFEENSKPDDLMPPAFAEMEMSLLGKHEPLMLKHDDLTNQDHMITLVLPAIVVCMLIALAVLIAGLLYKRRRYRPEVRNQPRFRFF